MPDFRYSDSGDFDEFDEFATYWWGPETEDLYIADMIENGMMAKFARAVLQNFKSRGT